MFVVFNVFICCDFRVAVGSPRANSSELDQRNSVAESPGAMYSCPITMDPSDCSDITQNFQSFVTGGKF
jgi:hypothetical protein